MKNINYKLKLHFYPLYSFASSALANNNTQAPIRLVIHGGAGNNNERYHHPRTKKEYKAKLTEAFKCWICCFK